MSTEIQIYEEPRELSVGQVTAQVAKIQQVMQAVMEDGVHYGRIPGTDKPTLLKAGAEKLALTFRLDPQYDTVRAVEEPEFILFDVRCTLYHIGSGQRIGSGLGSCSSRESKYAYRKASRGCPACGADAIIKGKAEYGGGWICYGKKGGCGSKFLDGDPAIESQSTGRAPNEDIWDQHNTILKMACKRALVAAVLNATAASDIFTQDVEDMEEPPAPNKPAPRRQESPPASASQQQQQVPFRSGLLMQARNLYAQAKAAKGEDAVAATLKAKAYTAISAHADGTIAIPGKATDDDLRQVIAALQDLLGEPVTAAQAEAERRGAGQAFNLDAALKAAVETRGFSAVAEALDEARLELVYSPDGEPVLHPEQMTPENIAKARVALGQMA